MVRSSSSGAGHKPIPVNAAKEIGENIHDELGRHGLLDSNGIREVFPYNHPQVMLPMRNDKTTIIDIGVFPKCSRRREGLLYGQDGTV